MAYYLTEYETAPAPETSPAAAPSRQGAPPPIGAPFRNPILSTKYWDGDTKLYYYGYRYYSPGMGRWVSRDPMGEYGGINLLTFCINEPLYSYDVIGLITQTYPTSKLFRGGVTLILPLRALPGLAWVFSLADVDCAA